MESIDLGGKWTLRKKGQAKAVPAQVPGCVHTDLRRAGVIDDPYYRDNEEKLQWIGEAEWIYEREFDVAPGILDRDRVLLRCEGLDTLATIDLNGRRLARTDNQFRVWEFDVKDRLRPGKNSIHIEFASPLAYGRRRSKADPRLRSKGSECTLPGGNWVRKSPCNFGWDWGPKLVTCGIWKSIGIVAFDTARLSDVQILQDHSKRGGVGLSVGVGVEIVSAGAAGALRATRSAGQTPASASASVRGLSVKVCVSFKGRAIAEATVPLRGGKARAELVIAKPRLWWPAGMGEQALYDVSVVLIETASGAELDLQSKRIGLRTLTLERHKDQWGESFYFAANGAAFFAKGANWIPADTFPSSLTREDYADLLRSARDANMNMLRVWGGGIYEADAFYDLCDELGLCVWQDFMFACMAYPTFDRAFLETVEAEARDNVRRLRHHPCLALWCGNNEMEQQAVGLRGSGGKMSWRDYRRLFDRRLARVVRELAGDTDYWPSSPHSPRGDRADFNNPRCGDAHLWNVWHGRAPFEWYRTCGHRFNSEFGFQAFPEPKTVRGFTARRDRNVTTAVMEHHQRSGIGNSTILQYLLSWFRLPTSFEMLLWTSQILQGLAIKYAVEHWRRSRPRGMGTLYWQLNDCWPAVSWSSIDYHGRWKALHYLARRFFAPVLASGLEDAATGRVELHVTSDRLAPVPVRLRWVVTDAAGRRLRAGGRRLRAPAQSNRRVATLRLADLLQARGAHDLLLWLEWTAPGQPRATEVLTLARPKHLELAEDPGLRAAVAPQRDGSFQVRLRARRPALWTWLELRGVDARLSDNFLHLRPGRPALVRAVPARRMTAAEFRRRLRICSLADTYREPA